MGSPSSPSVAQFRINAQQASQAMQHARLHASIDVGLQQRLQVNPIPALCPSVVLIILHVQVVIIVGLCAAMVSLLGYGSSTTYLAALLRRFIPSLLIGAPVAIKAALGDVCDQEGQAKAMAIFSLGYGIGSVLGEPVLQN